ncbi:MAG: hypothetical protein ACXW19_12110, partial [Thermoanaerobaculia bacterium]
CVRPIEILLLANLLMFLAVVVSPVKHGSSRAEDFARRGESLAAGNGHSAASHELRPVRDGHRSTIPASVVHVAA